MTNVASVRQCVASVRYGAMAYGAEHAKVVYLASGGHLDSNGVQFDQICAKMTNVASVRCGVIA